MSCCTLGSPRTDLFPLTGTTTSQPQASQTPVYINDNTVSLNSPISHPPSSAPLPSPLPFEGQLFRPDSSVILQQTRSRRSLTPPTYVVRTHSQQFNPTLRTSAWTDGKQTLLESTLARLTASVGFSLRWVDDPEWICFCSLFLPEARLITQKMLTQRLIPSELASFQEKARSGVAGELGTTQEDGWVGKNKLNLLAFMVNAKWTVRLLLPLSLSITILLIGL